MKVFNWSVLIVSIICAGILGSSLSKVGKLDRSVTVRGLSEKEVDADLALWPLTFSIGGNDLQLLQKEILSKNQIVEKYLADYGLESEDFTIQAAQVQDLSMNPYMDMNSRPYKYLAKQVFLVRSAKVKEVKKASSESLKLAGSGIAVGGEYGTRVEFEFTGLNQIKPEMIAEATENARKAAEQFARDSHSRVGKIKKASQGLFSIEDAAVGLEDKKSVRVVTTVEYLLK